MTRAEEQQLNRLAPVRARLSDFFEKPVSPAPLGFFRIALAGFLLIQAIAWFPDWLAFMGTDGWLQWEISGVTAPEWTLHIETVYQLFRPMGISPDQFVMGFYWCYVLAGVGLLVGWHTRIWAVLAWFLHYVIMTTLRTFTYGMDIFLHIALFYMMLMPVGKAFSLDVRQGRTKPNPTWGVTLSLRVLQIHVCLVYISAGFEKLASPAWHNGSALWKALVQPDFRQMDLTWLAQYPWIVVALAWFTIIVESGYFIAVWIPRVRLLWLASIIGMHIGIGLFMGLWFFGLVMILLSLSAFGYDALKDLRALRSRYRAAHGKVGAAA